MFASRFSFAKEEKTYDIPNVVLEHLNTRDRRRSGGCTNTMHSPSSNHKRQNVHARRHFSVR